MNKNVHAESSSLLLVFLVFLLIVAPTVGICADKNIKAQDIKIYTPTYQPVFEEFDPPLGTYTYKVAWQGIPAATVTVVVDKNGDRYNIVTKAKTYSGIDLFYRLRYTAEGTISALDLTPIETVIDHRENSRHKVTKISFEKDGGIKAVRYRKGTDDSKEELEFNPNNFTLDPISAAFLARGVDWKVGESKKFDTFNGKSRYLITLTASEKVIMKINGEEREAWQIVPKVENLTSPHSN